MSSGRLKRKFGRTIGFKIAAAYSVLFIASFIVLTMVAYVMVDATLLRKDRQMIEQEVQSLQSHYQSGGWTEFSNKVQEIDQFRKNNPFFTRAISAGNRGDVIFLQQYWKDFDLKAFDTMQPPIPGTWFQLPSRQGTYVLELYTAQNQDGSLFQVGISSEDRVAVLRRFREGFMTVAVPLILLAVGGGAFLSRRTLLPLRTLIDAVASIEAGNMDAKAPMTHNGDELDELGDLFNRMIEKINQLIRAMKGSLDCVAHDLRTPMTRFRNTAESALQRSGSVKSLREALQECVEESDNILQKLNMLMDISEAETGAMRLNVISTDMVRLAARVVEMYRFVAEEKGVHIETEFPAEALLEADADRICQVIANLLDNAVKFTSPGKRICVTIDCLPGRVQITVADSGVGIEPEEVSKIWDRLYRGKHSDHKGLGLGLSLVRAVVNAHCGEISVTSSPGAGSIFVMQMPVRVKTGAIFFDK